MSDRKKTFLKDLKHNGKLYEVINVAGYTFYTIECNGEEIMSTMFDYEPMVERWNKVGGEYVDQKSK